MEKPVLGILLGEACGIGPEIVSKLCAEEKLEKYCRPVLIGDLRVLNAGKKAAGVNFNVQIIDDVSEATWNNDIPMLDQRNLDPSEIKMGTLDPLSGKITGDMLLTSLELCKRGVIEGFVYGPLNKAAMQLGGYKFPDELRLMAHYLNWTEYHSELNVLNNLWTSRVTSHVPIREVADHITKEGIVDAVVLIHNTIKSAGAEHPRIAVAALNPHAGENGLCGREEIEVIKPDIKFALSELNINVSGPYPGDTVFINATKGHFDAVVTMYHDQGQIALKLLGFQFGVTVNGGLPYPITTPAHGTAFDIAGKGIASPAAMEQAVILAARIAARKKQEEGKD